MDFEQFKSNWSKISEAELGGLKSQLKMIPGERPIPNWHEILKNNPQKAAVLALFYPDQRNRTNFLLTLRASYKGVHSSQVSFPGGKQDKNDSSLIYTALRETQEEIGIDPENVKILREISKTYFPPSNFLVHTFLGLVDYTPVFVTNYEVEKVLEVPLQHLTDPRSLINTKLTTSYMKEADIPCFELNNQLVWGATAMMLSEIKDLFNSI